MNFLALLMVAVAVAMVSAEDLAGINTCIKGKDVIVITDVRAADEGQVLDLLNFFGRLANSLDEDGNRYYILSYPLVYYNVRTGAATTTSNNVHLVSQIPAAQSFIKYSIEERGDHPDINIALKDATKLLNGTSNSFRNYAEKVVLIISFDKYESPVSSEENSEEALETPSRVEMAQLGDSLKKTAQVLIYAIGGFDNIYSLFDLASCRDERCVFQIDQFIQLSKAPLFKDCSEE